MIACPKCGTTEGITAVQYIGAFDTISFQFKCQCGAMWKRGWGMRRRGAGVDRRKEMENVTVLPNRLQRLAAERMKGRE